MTIVSTTTPDDWAVIMCQPAPPGRRPTSRRTHHAAPLTIAEVAVWSGFRALGTHRRLDTDRGRKVVAFAQELVVRYGVDGYL